MLICELSLGGVLTFSITLFHAYAALIQTDVPTFINWKKDNRMLWLYGAILSVILTFTILHFEWFWTKTTQQGVSFMMHFCFVKFRDSSLCFILD